MSKKKIISIIAGTIILTLASVGIFKYVENKNMIERREIQIAKFQSRYDEINEMTPYEHNEGLLEMLKNDLETTYKNDPYMASFMSKHTFRMIEEGYFFKTAYEDNLKLTINMIRYKTKSKKNVESIEDVKAIVDDIRYNKKDKLNCLIVKAFDTSLKNYQVYIESSIPSPY